MVTVTVFGVDHSDEMFASELPIGVLAEIISPCESFGHVVMRSQRAPMTSDVLMDISHPHEGPWLNCNERTNLRCRLLPKGAKVTLIQE